MPGDPYGADMVPLSTSAISFIKNIQCQVEKSALCVPQSKANPAVNIEQGWTPVQLLVTDPSFQGSGLVKTCMAWALSSSNGPNSANLLHLAASYRVTLADLPSPTPKTIFTHWVTGLLATFQSFPSLSLLPVSPPWWFPSRFLETALVSSPG